MRAGMTEGPMRAVISKLTAPNNGQAPFILSAKSNLSPPHPR